MDEIVGTIIGCVILISIAFCSWKWAYDQWFGPPKNPLVSKIEQLVDSRETLEDKIDEIEDSVEELTDNNDDLKSEIKNRRSSRYLNEALKDIRINNNLDVIRRNIGYIALMKKEKKRLNKGIEVLLYLERQVTSDLHADKAIGRSKVKEIQNTINSAISRYRQQAGKYVVNEKSLQLPSYQTVWNGIN